MKLINEKEIFDFWAPIIEQSTGITDKSKLSWISKYCHNHEIYEAEKMGMVNESNSYAVLGAVNGMDATRFPSNPGTQASFSTATPGSGDKAHGLLPLAMQVAVQTIAFDLVPTVPMPGPMGVLTYLDYVYAGGVTAGAGANKPLIVKVNKPGATIGATTSPASGITFAYVGPSRLDGNAILHVVTGATYTSNTSILDLLTGATTTVTTLFGAGATPTEVTLVSALEDHITGFSGQALANADYTGDINDPYSREQGEDTMDNIFNLKLFNKPVEAKTFQVAAAVTREQVQDLKQFGIDAVPQVQTILLNEVTQSINKNILSRLFELGERNHKKIYNSEGVNFFLNLGATAVTVSGNIKYIKDATLTGITMNATENTSSPAENLHTRQRKILSKILAASNMINIRGRRGNANFIVVGGQVASAIQDISGYIAAPMTNTISQQTGSLYPAGSIAGLVVYVDPNMRWDDNRILVGRKGNTQDPGLVFMPYILADIAETIAEGTMAPKLSIKSRYALVEAGFHPETMYITLGVYINPGLGSLV